MIKEAEKTINLANDIMEQVPTAKLELHLDISPHDSHEGTSHLANMLVGYVRGLAMNAKQNLMLLLLLQ